MCFLSYNKIRLTLAYIIRRLAGQVGFRAFIFTEVTSRMLGASLDESSINFSVSVIKYL